MNPKGKTGCKPGQKHTHPVCGWKSHDIVFMLSLYRSVCKFVDSVYQTE